MYHTNNKALFQPIDKPLCLCRDEKHSVINIFSRKLTACFDFAKKRMTYKASVISSRRSNLTIVIRKSTWVQKNCAIRDLTNADDLVQLELNRNR